LDIQRYGAIKFSKVERGDLMGNILRATNLKRAAESRKSVSLSSQGMGHDSATVNAYYSGSYKNRFPAGILQRRFLTRPWTMP